MNLIGSDLFVAYLRQHGCYSWFLGVKGLNMILFSAMETEIATLKIILIQFYWIDFTQIRNFINAPQDTYSQLIHSFLHRANAPFYSRNYCQTKQHEGKAKLWFVFKETLVTAFFFISNTDSTVGHENHILQDLNFYRKI